MDAGSPLGQLAAAYGFAPFTIAVAGSYFARLASRDECLLAQVLLAPTLTCLNMQTRLCMCAASTAQRMLLTAMQPGGCRCCEGMACSFAAVCTAHAQLRATPWLPALHRTTSCAGASMRGVPAAGAARRAAAARGAAAAGRAGLGQRLLRLPRQLACLAHSHVPVLRAAGRQGAPCAINTLKP